MEQITDLERSWFLSPPWGQNIPPVEVNLLEKVYLKTNRAFGYCLGVQWYGDCWNYVVEVKDDFIYTTKHQIIGTGQIEARTVKKPFFVLGERVLLQFCDRGTKHRLVLGSVNDHLKNICQIEHSRHRSPFNFLLNLMAGLAAYTYLPKRFACSTSCHFLVPSNSR